MPYGLRTREPVRCQMAQEPSYLKASEGYCHHRIHSISSRSFEHSARQRSFRKMSPGPRGRPLLAGTQTLKVISYNILAPRYANYNSYCPPQFLNWEYRQRLVLQELEHHNADIVALQVGSVLRVATLAPKRVL